MNGDSGDSAQDTATKSDTTARSKYFFIMKIFNKTNMAYFDKITFILDKIRNQKVRIGVFIIFEC